METFLYLHNVYKVHLTQANQRWILADHSFVESSAHADTFPRVVVSGCSKSRVTKLSGPTFCTRRSEGVYIAFAASKVEFSPGGIANGAGGR